MQRVNRVTVITSWTNVGIFIKRNVICYNYRFRRGFKWVFRWLPCVHIVPGDITGTRTIKGTVVGRMSMTENTKYGGYERNGSMIQTCIESLDDNSVSPSTAMISYRTLPAHRMKEDAL